MGVTTTQTNKPFNPRGNDQSPKGYNRASLYSGKALDFDGVNDYVTFDGFAGTLSDDDAWTLCGYFKANENSGTSIWFSAHTQYNANVIRVGVRQNELGLFYDDSHLHDSFIGTENLNNDEWHFIALSRPQGGAGTKVILYVNGIASGTLETDITWNVATKFSIGQEWDGGGASDFFDGQIANTKVFSTALTAAQVADLYNNPEKVVPTGVADSALKLYLPMMEGAGTTAYDGSPVGFTEDIVTGFTNGTTYPLDSFASSGDDITTAIKTNGFGGCVSNGHTYTNGQKVKVKFTYQKNSGNDLRVLFSSLVTGAGTAKSDIQNVSASGEFEHTFTMTADGVAYLQLGTGNAGHSIDAVITDVYVSPYKSANHGTISGATYAHGIGAPVAQTAVISWNKGTNEVLYSEDFSQSDWATSNMTKTTGQTDYIGGTNAVRVNCSSGVNAWFSQPTSGVAVGDVTIGAYIKGVSAGGTLSFSTAGSDRSNSRINYTTEWVYYEWTITETSSSPRVQIDNYSDGGGQEAIDVYFCFPRLVEGTNADVYVRTGATAQTSDVLLPQGLTTGRDITGVNLFENVRKQGALNLDGNSRALVHDNASLDYTSAATLESWVYWTGEGDQGILGRWFAPDSQKSLMLYASDSDSVRVYYSNDGVASFNKEASQTLSVGNWYHFVTTYDGSTIKIYVNAVEGNSAAYSSDIYVSSKHVDIGTYQEDLNKAYNGQIAQPRIYNRALTAEEVLQNYNSGKNTYK